MTDGILTQLLNKFLAVITLGYAALLPDAMHLMSYLVALELVFLGVYWALGAGNIGTETLKKVTAIGFFVWIIQEMPDISKAILKSFGSAGLIAGGNVITIQDMLDPSAIVDIGFIATEPIFNALQSKWVVTFTGILTGLAGLLVLFAYFVIAVNLFLIIIEFYVFTVCSVILIPFAVFKPLSFLSEKAIGGTFSISIKFMVIAFVISFSLETLKAITFSSEPQFRELFSTVLCAGTIAFLCIHLPNTAARLLGGAPSLTAGAAFGFGTSAIGTAAGATVLTKKMRSEGVGAVKKAAGAASLLKNKIRSKP